MHRKYLTSFLVACLALTIGAEVKCQQQYTLVSSFIGGSNGEASNPLYNVSYSIGIPVAGEMVSDSYSTLSGVLLVGTLGGSICGTADTVAPSITCPPDTLVRPTSLSGAVVNYMTPVGTDNCSATTTRTTGLAGGTTFPIGTTTNTFVARDPAGNTASCSFTVTVPDPHCAANKVNVCHNGHTLCISINGLPAHLAHGDLLGPCSLGKVGDPTEEIPTQFGLQQNYPNPFNPTTKIRFSLPSQSTSSAEGRVGVGSHVTLKVYDLLGREVATLVNEQMESGHHEARFDASGLTSGVYFYRLQTAGFVETKKLMVLR